MSSGSGMYNVAPSHNGVKISRCNGLKESPDTTLNRSVSLKLNVCFSEGRKWETGPCLPRIPLGFPVDPEVKATYASSSGPAVTPGFSIEWAAKGSSPTTVEQRESLSRQHFDEAIKKCSNGSGT